MTEGVPQGGLLALGLLHADGNVYPVGLGPGVLLPKRVHVAFDQDEKGYQWKRMYTSTEVNKVLRLWRKKR